MVVSVRIFDQLSLLQAKLLLVEMASRSVEDQEQALALQEGFFQVQQALEDLRGMLRT